jgi:hypothetical protein
MDLMGFRRLLFQETEETLVRKPCDGDVCDKRGLLKLYPANVENRVSS